MLETENPIVQSPQEHIEFPIDDDNIETAHFIEHPSRLETSSQMDDTHEIHNTQMDNRDEIDNTQMDSSHDIDAKKKRTCKGKKK